MFCGAMVSEARIICASWTPEFLWIGYLGYLGCHPHHHHRHPRRQNVRQLQHSLLEP